MTVFIQVIDPSLMEVSVTSSVDDDAMSATESDMMKASMTTSISDGLVHMYCFLCEVMVMGSGVCPVTRLIISYFFFTYIS